MMAIVFNQSNRNNLIKEYIFLLYNIHYIFTKISISYEAALYNNLFRDSRSIKFLILHFHEEIFSILFFTNVNFPLII